MSMLERILFGKVAAGLTIAFACAMALGCATSDPVDTSLDPVTSVTITSINTPLVMYRDDPSRAAYARNYLHIGPLQVNRSGNYQYFLWIGIWNTMQTATPAEHMDGFDSIVLFVNGEPLQLDVSGWTPEAIGASQPVYLKPVASSTDAYYRVTADQIRLIAESREIRLKTSGASSREFGTWDATHADMSGWQTFLDY